MRANPLYFVHDYLLSTGGRGTEKCRNVSWCVVYMCSIILSLRLSIVIVVVAEVLVLVLRWPNWLKELKNWRQSWSLRPMSWMMLSRASQRYNASYCVLYICHYTVCSCQLKLWTTLTSWRTRMTRSVHWLLSESILAALSPSCSLPHPISFSCLEWRHLRKLMQNCTRKFSI